MGTNGYGFSVWNLLNSIVPAPRILGWLLDFWKSFAHVVYGNRNIRNAMPLGIGLLLLTRVLSARNISLIFGK
jgi:hypothetical protein